MSLEKLFAEIERVTPEGGDWCDVTKAEGLAALIVAHRPSVVVELGVWMGGSAIPMALALAHNRTRHRSHVKLVAIDAWSNTASIDGQNEADRAWWGKADHEKAYRQFVMRVGKHDLASVIDIVRSPSDAADVPEPINMLHVDGNHGEQAIRDVLRFAAGMPLGGVLVLDDLNWSGGSVSKARQLAEELGFRELYALGTGCVMLRCDYGTEATLLKWIRQYGRLAVSG